jgi:hypothetical protein
MVGNAKLAVNVMARCIPSTMFHLKHIGTAGAISHRFRRVNNSIIVRENVNRKHGETTPKNRK